ncbi:MAG: ATP synthase F1 subunit gamma, partial [Dehalococcoidia bacterium]|nr:ATP synthase F1 subunit gamma [Dehalococcoidia bacterium]
TRAMEMIAASKMRRAQEQARSSRPYTDKMVQVLADLATRPPEDVVHPLLESREVKTVELIHISTDRGLCGGLNGNLNRQTAAFIVEKAVPVRVVTVGRKGREFIVRCGCHLAAEFSGLGDRPSLLDTTPISRIVIDDYTNRQVDVVYLAYSQFVTTMVQRPVLKQLLPIHPAGVSGGQGVEYIYEPSSSFVLFELLPRFVELQVYHAILESIASEQSARMVAMRHATENAEEYIEDLTLSYNKVRQEMITKELLDLIGGAAQISKAR